MQQAICPYCKVPMAWSGVHNQWYCGTCGLYFPPQHENELDKLADEIGSIFDSKPAPPPPMHYCQRCSRPLSWIPEYGRWYCYTCQMYV